MIKRATYACTPLLLLLCACSLNVDQVLARTEAIYDSKPRSAYSHLFQNVGKWRKIILELKTKNYTNFMHLLDYEFNVRITSCSGETIFLEEIYINDIAFSNLNDGDLNDIKSYNYSTYLKEDIYLAYTSICGQLTGGSKPFGRISSRVFRIK